MANTLAFRTYWQVYGTSYIDVPDGCTLEQAQRYAEEHFESLPLPCIEDNVDYSWEPDFEGSLFVMKP